MNKTALFLIVGTMTMMSACKDQETTSTVMTDDAAQMVSMSLAENSMGATAIIQSSVSTGNSTMSNAPQKVKSVNSDFIFSMDTTYTVSSKPGAIIIFSLTATYGFDLTLNNQGQLTSATENYTYTGSYDAPRISSTHTGSGVLSLTNMNTTVCTVNGTFTRTSDDAFKGTQPKSSHSETNLSFTNILVNKSTSTIQSGTALLTIVGTVPNKGDFSYSGSITFNGDNTATLIIKDQTYTVNLKTGDYHTK